MLNSNVKIDKSFLKSILFKQAFVARFLLTSIMLVFMGTLCVSAFTVPKQTELFYVDDFANLLSQESEDYIVSVNTHLYEKTGAQVVVATVENLQGATVEEYATAMFRQYGIGSAEKNNGILILLALEERKCRIEVGYGLEGAINDAKAGRIMDDYMIGYFKNDEWDKGVVNGFDAIVSEICTEYSVEIDRNQPALTPDKQASQDAEDKWHRFEKTCMISMAVALVVGLIGGKILSGHGTVPVLVSFAADFFYFKTNYGIWYALIAFVAWGIALLIGWAITSPDNGSSGGGSYSSSYDSDRSSYSRSSSSSGGYSGGGGSSGGGGASRGF